jgi:ribulose-phosphate 3-epimerase
MTDASNKKDFWICPSILSADFAHLADDINAVLAAGADRIHVDVMDNHYVPNLTFGPLICNAIRKAGIAAPMDVHLMIEPVDDLIPKFIEAGADCIVFHPEASKHVDRSLRLIKESGVKAGLAINPATSEHVLDNVLDLVDRVLVMTVNPGFGGQKFIKNTIPKIKRIKSIIDTCPHEIRLEVDGGVNVDNIRSLADIGVDTFVAGSAIFNQPDYAKVISQMRDNLAG